MHLHTMFMKVKAEFLSDQRWFTYKYLFLSVSRKCFLVKNTELIKRYKKNLDIIPILGIYQTILTIYSLHNIFFFFLVYVNELFVYLKNLYDEENFEILGLTWFNIQIACC